ncbi:AmmeMemoRadiSam system protein A [Sulfurimonas sp.]|nr:AmmeMemoRadiSam system protein A [Sulfurimonas sp.]
MLDSILLRIAKSSILSRLDENYSFDESSVTDRYPFLKDEGACFVTLKARGDLRGCIGSVVAHRRLYDDIIANSASAAFKDPRFESLSIDELSYLTLEVSVLSEPTIIEYKDFDDLCSKVKPNIDGLILEHDIYKGTFLPQVWEQLQTPKLFLEHLSLKAGSFLSIYEEHPTIYRYSVDALEGNFDEVLQL